MDGVSAMDEVSGLAKDAVDDVTSLGRSPLKLKLLVSFDRLFCKGVYFFVFGLLGNFKALLLVELNFQVVNLSVTVSSRVALDALLEEFDNFGCLVWC